MAGAIIKKLANVLPVIATGAVLAVAAVPASAQTYNPQTSFNGGAFQGGSGTGGVSFTPQTYVASGCIGNASFACYSPQANSGDYTPTVLNNTGGDYTFSSTLTVPSNSLLLHPGSGTGVDAILLFTAPTTSLYSVVGNFIRLDSGGSNGVVVSVFQNATQIYSQTATDLLAHGFSFGGSTALSLNSGDTLSFVVGNNGNHFNDSTGLQLAISAVPEAGTWAMMILGLGMVGGAMRSRRKPVAARTFA